jgi:hydroxymethylbilane synthase
MSDRIHQVIPAEVSLHAVGQGALGIECRTDDPEVLELLKALEHTTTAQRCYAERSFLRSLEGGCQVPIGVNTQIDGDTLTLTGIVASVDGQQVVKDTVAGDALNAEQLGIELAQKMRTQGAQEILEAIFAEQRS